MIIQSDPEFEAAINNTYHKKNEDQDSIQDLKNITEPMPANQSVVPEKDIEEPN